MGKRYRRRVSDLIRTHLMDLLKRKIKDPRVHMVTITDVSITDDAAHADVYFSVLGDEETREEAQSGLESASGWLRHELGQRLDLRNTPELAFHFDPSLERGEHIASILSELGLGDAREDEEPSESS